MLEVGRTFSVFRIDRLKTMGEQPSRLACFLVELRRRHVVRVAVGYAAVAFVVLQLGEIVLPAFSAEWALQFVVVFTILGFPVVMALAWVFDITSEGIRVTAELDGEGELSDRPTAGILPRLAFLIVTLLAVGGVGSWWTLDKVGKVGGTDVTSSALGSSVVPAAYDPDEAIRSLAVLPLQNFSEDAEQDYFAAGMHEALLERLSQLPEVRVVSRTSVAQYAGTDKTVPEIAQELGVEGIVEGSVFRAGDEIRITVQLIHGASDTHIWAQSYQRSFSDLLALQSEVADAIAGEIRKRLSTDGATPMLSYTSVSEVPGATEAFMRARFEQSRETPEGLRAAIEHYGRAMEADPEFAGAYAGLASAEMLLGMSEASDPTEALERARVLALKAFELDPELLEAHDILALIEEQLDEKTSDPLSASEGGGLLTEVRVARGSPPTDPGSGAGSGGGATAGGGAGSNGADSVTVISVDPALVASAGDFRRDSTSILESYTPVGNQLRAASAGRASQRSRMASEDPARMVAAAQRLQATGRTAEAVEVLTGVCEVSPDHEEAWEALESLYASMGDYDEILDLRRLWVEHAGGDAESIDRLEDRMRRDGPRGYWEWRLEVLQKRVSEGESVSPVYLAAAQAGTGHTEEAMASLRQAVRERDGRLASLRTDPVWDVMRSDPRFSSLLRGLTNPAANRRFRPGD